MDTRYLNYILTIAQKGNMTKAAEELFVSQSTLSSISPSWKVSWVLLSSTGARDACH